MYIINNNFKNQVDYYYEIECILFKIILNKEKNM